MKEILNPNCSETVVRLKKSQIGDLSKGDLEVYLNVLDNWTYMETSMGDEYSKLRGNKYWKAHYFGQSVGNKLIAFAYWSGLDFDTDEPWHSGDIMDWEQEGRYDEVAEELSYWFTHFENFHSDKAIVDAI